MENTVKYDVLVIGAGPSGACAAAILKQKGLSVAIVEKELFPRFSIGESLLPQSMVFLEKAGLLDAVNKGGFQKKNGAAFLSKGEFSYFNFEDKFTEGPFQTFQVQRAKFDKILADACAEKGVEIFYQHSVEAISFDNDKVTLKVKDVTTQNLINFEGQFVLDGSGFGRTLPRLLKLDKPSNFPSRRAVFCHMKTNFPEYFDVNKILVTVDDHDKDVWFWTIPFPNNTCSFGIVGTEEYFKTYGDKSNAEIIQASIDRNPKLKEIMTGSMPSNEARTIMGYAADVESLYGKRFALLGNAGEFLDPVFSSGVTIALQSANLAAELVAKELAGEKVDWEVDFSQALKAGVNCFKTFVRTWYTGELQSIIFYPKPEPRIKKMICSVLAGYAWDKKNPYVLESDRNVKTLAEICEG
jgi:Dehydrogenases (flavoproteins)